MFVCGADWAESAVYGDYESRWTAMLTGEASLTLAVYAAAQLQFSQQHEGPCSRGVSIENRCKLEAPA